MWSNFMSFVANCLNSYSLSLFFAKKVNRVLKYKGNKTTLSASVVYPVSREIDPVIPFSDPDLKLSYQLLIEFLENDDEVDGN